MGKKFTQGDWHAVSNVIRDYKGLIIATVYNHLQINMPLKEKLANAKLIAAAPDLLEALENLLDECLSQPMESSSREAMRKAQKAIKKALE